MAVDDPTDLVDFLTFREARGHAHEPAAFTELASELDDAVDGEVRFDEYSQVLYATDGSIYSARPAGVVIPRSIEDVQSTIRRCGDHDVPILPRGAGSSLAGQAVGPGCVVLDLSKYMDEILEIEPSARRVTVQPGVVQDDLDEALAPHRLQFAPDPASSNRATIGGGIGNNSTGAHSVRYGITDAYTDELRVVLADGSLVRTREIVLDSPEWDAVTAGDDLEARIYETVGDVHEEHQTEIESRYPDLKRCVSGYNLDRVVYENDDGDRCINLSKLIVGAEGTLGVVVEATLDLVTKPTETALVLYCFDDLIEALRAVPVALEHDVSAVELLDEEVFRLAAESSQYAEYADPIPEGTAAALMLEFDSELVASLEAAIGRTNERFFESGPAFEVVEAYEQDAQDDLWKLRKAAIPLLMSMAGDPKPYPFIEDATVPPGELATYVESFESILDDHDTSAAYFAHAGAGTLHIRPILNLKEASGIETMHAIAEDVTDLVLEHHGSFSGEHGDGMARTEFNPKMYGPELWSAFKRVKTAFDPDWLLNPGNVVYRDGPDDGGPPGDRGVGADMRTNLRYGPAYQSIEPETAMDFEAERGFSHLVELCNGCGTCRQTGSETMCPTYRASKDEIESTRGRANLLRAAISGDLPEDELYTRSFQEEVLDLCVGCKGCANDCPTGVDLAKLKAEVKHEYHQREGTSVRERVFANVDTVSRLGSVFAPLSNWAQRFPGSDRIAEHVLGIAPDRDLPTFARHSLEDWFDDRGGSLVTPEEAVDRALLFPDTYTNYSEPAVGKAAIRLLEAANVHVEIPTDVGPSGRAAVSEGFLDRARDRARHNVEVLSPYVADGWSIVCVEPSDVAVFHDEYGDLLTGEDVLAVGANTYGVCEYLDVFERDASIAFDADEQLVYHGHCHAKALDEADHVAAVLDRAGFAVEVLDSGCCGMAGSFGYEAEHYDLSMAIGRILDKQVDAADGTPVAPGASCRTQLTDIRDSRPPHPIEKLAGALSEETN